MYHPTAGVVGSCLKGNPDETSEECIKAFPSSNKIPSATGLNGGGVGGEVEGGGVGRGAGG